MRGEGKWWIVDDAAVNCVFVVVVAPACAVSCNYDRSSYDVPFFDQTGPHRDPSPKKMLTMLLVMMTAIE